MEQTLTKERSLTNKRVKKKDETFMTREEFIAKINRALEGEEVPLDIEAFRKEFIYPFEEEERKKKALQGK